MDPNNIDREPEPMFPKVAAALGVGLPPGTVTWPWPKKPLGHAPKGQTGQAKTGRASTAKGHSRPSRGSRIKRHH